MRDSLKAALREGAEKYSDTNSFMFPNFPMPQQVNVVKISKIYNVTPSKPEQYTANFFFERMVSTWMVIFLAKPSISQEGFILKKGEDCERFYLDILGYRHLSDKEKKSLIKEIDEIERMWDNKETFFRKGSINDLRNIQP